MFDSNRDHQRTLNFAQHAIGFIQTHQLPADPPSFELWYTYAARYIPALNQDVNALIVTQGTLSCIDADGLHDQYLGSFRIGAQIEKIGEEIGGEVNHVLAMIESAVGSANRYGDNLLGLDVKLQGTTDQVTLRTIIAGLVRSTKLAADENTAYRTQLQSALTEISSLRAALETVRSESQTDPLTTLANRKQFNQSLDRAMDQAALTGQVFSLLMCDVDHFKKFNDTFGHTIGDDVLRLIAFRIKQSVTGQDLAARYGGEEFAVILSNSNLQQAATLAERIRSAVTERDIFRRSTAENLGRVTISIGVAQWRTGETAIELIDRADALLYAAKRNGRNQVAWR